MEKVKSDPYLTTYSKMKSNGAEENLNVRDKTIKLLKENIEVNLYDPGFAMNFLNYDTKSMSNERKKLINWSSRVQKVCFKGYYQESKTFSE
jgi:hypothetical protein